MKFSLPSASLDLKVTTVACRTPVVQNVNSVIREGISGVVALTVDGWWLSSGDFDGWRLFSENLVQEFLLRKLLFN